MGSNRRLNIAATGFPGTNQTWRFIQDAWNIPLTGLASILGDYCILFGCEVVGTQRTAGMIAINGVIYPFTGGNNNTVLSLQKDVVSVPYDVDIDNDGEQDVLPTYETSYYISGNGGNGGNALQWLSFKRLKTLKELSDFSLPSGIVIDPAYVHTDNNFTNILFEKLQNLVSNVQADWNTSSSALPSFIKNKPAMMQKHASGFMVVGDLTATNQDFQVTIPTILTTNYHVMISVETNSTTNPQESATFGFVIHSKTTNSFRIRFQEFRGAVQNIRFNYIVLK